jgi:hypothetical protein
LPLLVLLVEAGVKSAGTASSRSGSDFRRCLVGLGAFSGTGTAAAASGCMTGTGDVGSSDGIAAIGEVAAGDDAADRDGGEEGGDDG